MPFKVKRPYSPDTIGINNYKRQRLIQDFENLSISLSDDSSTYGRSSSSNRGWRVNLPSRDNRRSSNRNKGGGTPIDMNEYQFIYEKWKEQIQFENLQIVKYVNWKLVIYGIWLSWFNALPYDNIDADIVMDYSSAFSNSDIGYIDNDIDIDMDT